MENCRDITPLPFNLHFFLAQFGSEGSLLNKIRARDNIKRSVNTDLGGGVLLQGKEERLIIEL